VPAFTSSGALFGVLDVDAVYPDAFDQTDQYWLEKILSEILTPVLS
jgi:putative methionine-R-sulfoxide reductase with GAF domain